MTTDDKHHRIYPTTHTMSTGLSRGGHASYLGDEKQIPGIPTFTNQTHILLLLGGRPICGIANCRIVIRNLYDQTLALYYHSYLLGHIQRLISMKEVIEAFSFTIG